MEPRDTAIYLIIFNLMMKPLLRQFLLKLQLQECSLEIVSFILKIGFMPSIKRIIFLQNQFLDHQKSGGLFSSSTEPQDYFHGKIYQNFRKSTPRNYPEPSDIVKQHVMFDGIWSGSVYIDAQQIINFKTDLPYEFVQEEYPIGSDSMYRKDLKKLVEGDKQAAQAQKQAMQQQQRKDKQLRLHKKK